MRKLAKSKPKKSSKSVKPKTEQPKPSGSLKNYAPKATSTCMTKKSPGKKSIMSWLPFTKITSKSCTSSTTGKKSGAIFLTSPFSTK